VFLYRVTFAFLFIITMDAPKHIAIIMDGNGRWAKKRGLPKIIGHQQGVESVKNIVKSSIKFGVKYLTLYAFSTENWHRPKKEVKAIFGLLENFLDNQMRLFEKNNVKLSFIGERDKIWPKLREKMSHFENQTKNNDALSLNIALNYGGREEILSAVRNLVDMAKDGNMDSARIDEKFFSTYLYTKNIPDPDLLIRTSGEMRVSNFLLWQISYSEIYVTEKLWPDFREKDLELAIESYRKRERRYGK